MYIYIYIYIGSNNSNSNSNRSCGLQREARFARVPAVPCRPALRTLEVLGKLPIHLPEVCVPSPSPSRAEVPAAAASAGACRGC